MTHAKRLTTTFFTLLVTLTTGMLPVHGAIWLEGEAPATAPANVQYGTHGWGRTDFISGGAMLSLSIPDKEVAQRVGADGAVFGYAFTVDQAGDYALWASIGYEFVRSPFDWRMDDGAWSTLSSDEPTVDVVPLQRWNELGWQPDRERNAFWARSGPKNGRGPRH